MFPHEVVEKVGTGAKKESLKGEERGGEERKEKETPSRKSSLRLGSLSIRRFWGKVGTSSLFPRATKEIGDVCTQAICWLDEKHPVPSV